MARQPRKMSEIMKEMSELLLRDPRKVPSSEAAHVALFFANLAWNETVGLDHPREGYRSAWETIEAENPELWNELKSNDIDAMIDELVQYKKAHYPDDRRRILTCGIPHGKVRVEWLDEKYVAKAHRRGKVGWNVGRHVEVIPHYRRPHLMLAWTGPGRSVPKIVPRRGSVVHRSIVEKVPTGFMVER